MTKVFLAGIAVVDFVFSVEELPAAAEKYVASDAQIVGGGCAANAAVAVSRLGGEAVLASRLGDDPLADLIAADLKREGVNTDFLHRADGGRSSFSSVYVDRSGERQIMNFRGEGLTTDTAWLDQVPASDVVLVDTRWREGALHALKIANDLNIPSVLDAEAPIDPEVLAGATHVAFSRTGLQSLSDKTDPAKALEEIAKTLNGWACVTDGEDGVYYTTADGIAHAPAFQVPVKDTLGAGDIWHGAFALSLGEGADEAKAVRFANAAAALKCMNFGGRSGCPDRQTTENFLKERT